MNTNIWRTKLAFGSYFGNLRAMGSVIILWSIPLKLKKSEVILSTRSCNIEKSLKISFGFIFVSLCTIGMKFWWDRLPVYSFLTKKTACSALSSQGLVYRSFPDGRTLSKSFWFCSWLRIYIYVHIIIFSTNTRNRARPRTYTKLWSA